MYTVKLMIIQAPGSAPWNLITYKQEGTYDAYSLLPMTVKVEKKARVKVNLGFLKKRYIDFTGGKNTKGEFNGVITMGDPLSGIRITWLGKSPPHRIKEWSFL